ncbi:MAG: hypothetical protein AAGG80_05265 [Pseudomonadota bacterium]
MANTVVDSLRIGNEIDSEQKLIHSKHTLFSIPDDNSSNLDVEEILRHFPKDTIHDEKFKSIFFQVIQEVKNLLSPVAHLANGKSVENDPKIFPGESPIKYVVQLIKDALEKITAEPNMQDELGPDHPTKQNNEKSGTATLTLS